MEIVDLYGSDEVANVPLQKICGGGIHNLNMESCVAAAVLPDRPNAVVLGDSKLGADSPRLIFERHELDAFVADYGAGKI
ncbi:DUF397 domain-containing protein [Micromonospora maritima]|uniref:DUF397 domain-containing protein n=1 Tax=Micromonospora maritima TaxID=986711 RepID=UPI00157DA807|nr:DUF397 domain-containing protein [Micromonospora maritima]